MTDRILLWAGVAAPLVFLATVLLAAMTDPDYSHVSNAVSELGQRGAPNARGVGIGFAVSAVLSGVFGVGTIRAAGTGETKLRRAGGLLIAYSVLAILPGTVFPMDPFGTEMTLPGLMHIVLVALGALALIALLLIGGQALGGRHRWFGPYSWASIAAMLAGGVLSGVAGFYAIPVLGATERLTQTAYLLWMVVFALLLLGRSVPRSGK